MSPLSPDDVVPRLRSDVVIANAPAGMGGGLVDIKPHGGDVLRLHAFELSLARMLDGRRKAQEVVDRAVQLGLPMGLPALGGFIRELEELHLVASGNGGPSPWQERTAWRPTERTLFQAALRAARQGNVTEARRALDTLLITAPRNGEARMLRTVLGDRSAREFQDAFLSSERAWLRDASPSRAELRAVRRSFMPLGVLAALAAAVLVGVFVPFPRNVNAPATLAPVATAEVNAPRDADVLAVSVDEGQKVAGGDVLYTDTRGPVHAPFSGVVTNLMVSVGRSTVKGQRAAVIEDQSRLVMTARPAGSGASKVRPGQTASLTLGDRVLKTKLETVQGGEARAVVDNSRGEVEPGTATADIEVPAASLWQRMR